MECYIKCPPDKNVSLAEGEKFIDFKVEEPKTNYNWTRFRTFFKLSSYKLVSSLPIKMLFYTGSVHLVPVGVKTRQQYWFPDCT